MVSHTGCERNHCCAEPEAQLRLQGDNCIEQHRQVAQHAQRAAPVIALQCGTRDGSGDELLVERRHESCSEIGAAILASLEGHWLLQTSGARRGSVGEIG